MRGDSSAWERFPKERGSRYFGAAQLAQGDAMTYLFGTRPRWLPGLVLAAALALAASPAAAADAESSGESVDERSPPATELAPAPAEDAVPRPLIDPSLSADAIYQRVLDNRFDASAQDIAIISGDRAGRSQSIEIKMLWRRYPQLEASEATETKGDGVLSRTLVRYFEPFDLRNTGYLIINKADLPNDQFVYLESMRRVRRISLRSESVIGTDLSVEDIIPKEMDEASYERMPDDDVDGTPCYVIDATPTPDAESGYSKLRLYIEGEHFVPLKTRYWDQVGIEVKELKVDPTEIREIEGVWIPLISRMKHLVDESYTQLNLTRITPNPDLPKKFFTVRQLEASRLRLPKEIRTNSVTIE
jgi:hypothetical protein